MSVVSSSQQRDLEAYQHFSDILKNDLKQNIKPVIMSLTMLAEDYSKSAVYISNSIEEYIVQVPPEIKILGLYLMDSIIKNIKSNVYLEIFEKKIVNLFEKVFQSVNVANREAMFKLRQTWNDLFSKSVLFEIDLKIHKIDSAWPITASYQPTIQTKPKQIKGDNVQTQQQQQGDSNKNINRDPRVIKTKPQIQLEQKPVLVSSQQKQEPSSQTQTKPTVNKTSPVSSSSLSVKTVDLLTSSPVSNKKPATNKTDQSSPVSAISQPIAQNKQNQVILKDQIQQQQQQQQQDNKNINRDPRMNKNKSLSQLEQTKSTLVSSQSKLELNISQTKTITNNKTSPKSKTSDSSLTQQNKKLITSSPTNSKVLKPTNNNENKSKIFKRSSSAQIQSTETKKFKTSQTTSPSLVKPNNSNDNKPSSSTNTKTKQEIKSHSTSKIPSLLQIEVPQINISTATSTMTININNLKQNQQISKQTTNTKKQSPTQSPINNSTCIITVTNEQTNQSQSKIKETVINQVNNTTTTISTSTIKATSINKNTTCTTNGDVDQRTLSIGTKNIKIDDLKNILHNPLLNKIIQNTNNIIPTPSTVQTTTNLTNQPDQEFTQKPSLTQTTTKTASTQLIEILPPAINKIQSISKSEYEIMVKEDCKINESEDLYASYEELPPIKPKDINDNQNDSLLIIDARSYRIQPDTRRIIKFYYQDYEVFCNTRTKEVYVDQKLVSKMGDPSKEIMLNGRRVRLMYMGKRIEIWIDGISFHFRADSPPKQISLTSQTNQIKRYYVTIDSRTMDMYFNSFKVCQINGGPYGMEPAIIMTRLAPDDYEQHEISFVCPPKRIMIDNIPRKMRYDLFVPCIELDNGLFHVIRFSGSYRDIFIDDQPYRVPFDKTARIKLNGRAHELAWGGPGYEVIIDGRPYELQFNKPAREIVIGTRTHLIYICGNAPDVKICGRLPRNFTQEANQNELKQVQLVKKPPPLMEQDLTNIPTLVKPNPSKPQQQQQQQQQKQIPNVQELLQKLIKHNILPSKKEEKTSEKEINESEMKIPDLTSFESDLLKHKYNAAIKNLYNGVQCAQCGNRFSQTDSSGQSTRYSRHLDWHFRQNKKEKEEINKAHSRLWYFTLQDWILFEEISEDKILSQDFANHQETSNNQSNSNENVNINDTAKVHESMYAYETCLATDDIGDSCCICNDPFEIFWIDETEEWHFKDAIRIGNRIYHPICLQDNQEYEQQASSSLLSTSNLPEITKFKDEPI